MRKQHLRYNYYYSFFSTLGFSYNLICRMIVPRMTQASPAPTANPLSFDSCNTVSTRNVQIVNAIIIDMSDICPVDLVLKLVYIWDNPPNIMIENPNLLKYVRLCLLGNPELRKSATAMMVEKVKTDSTFFPSKCIFMQRIRTVCRKVTMASP